jgi:hypothetical protein
MSPGGVLIYVIVALICGFIADAIGKSKHRKGAFWLGLLLGVIGIVIIACMPRSREGEIAEAQRQLEIQQEAARRAGYPPQGPDGPPPWPQG